MATGIEFSVNHPLAVRRWSRELNTVAPKESNFFQLGLVGTDDASVIRMQKDLALTEGYEVTYALRDNLVGTSTTGDDILEGKEKALNFNSGSMRVNQERVAEKSGGRASASRVPYDVRDSMKQTQSIWWGEHFDEVFITKLSGSLGVNTWNTIDSTSIAWDGNALRAPSANRNYVGNTLNAATSTLTAAMGFSLDNLDTMILQASRQSATTLRRKMKPVRYKGKSYWICFIDLLQDAQIRQATGGRYYDLERAKLQGGAKGSPLWDNADWTYRNVMVYVVEELVRFDNYGAGGTLKAVRGLFMGASAGYMALGPGEVGSDQGFFWKERLIDYENKLGVATGKLWGFDKCSYTTTVGGATKEDYGVITFDTYVSSF